MKKGLIQIYTGDGKGKTTSAVGLAIRARGHNLKVCYIYFHKDSDRFGYGELKCLKKLGVDIFGFAKSHPHFCKKTKISEISDECHRGLEFIEKIFKEKKYDVVIVDEIFISLRDGFISEEELIELLEKKPKNLELILTGRGATQKIIDKADLVSQIQKIKHPYDLGIKSRKGIEF
ncbi:MAG: cob(I)yrinic acid a,c-diamide adenosyltransferase [Candidatus Omnitrophica bacterium]|nr:cob(I)yrinic acid a,c-diamide adenosyltransferase [Candidatus Omnitrophota bacterium]MCM8831961.1 cob(I)yrinic acid a,c-diamide adenosyltransferase [Candidatus Omnitrophota bacterium]